MTTAEAIDVLQKLRWGANQIDFNADFKPEECAWILDQISRLDPSQDTETTESYTAEEVSRAIGRVSRMSTEKIVAILNQLAACHTALEDPYKS